MISETPRQQPIVEQHSRVRRTVDVLRVFLADHRMKVALLAAFAAVYILWGSTYLAIAVVVETIPPFIGAAVRFILAGLLLMLWSRRKGAAWPARLHWRNAVIVGGLLLAGGNGVLVWAEQVVPSGVAALLVATVPLWLVAITAVSSRQRPSWPVMFGLILGLVGVGILVDPRGLVAGDSAMFVGTVAILLGSFSWALGTFVSRRLAQASSQVMTTGMNMVAGGLLLILVATATGELPQLDAAAISLRSWLAFAFLLVFGSIIGFSAYMWLVKVTTPARAASNFYVNPVVAVLAGWLIAGEALTGRMIVAMIIIVVAVAFIVTQKR